VVLEDVDLVAQERSWGRFGSNPVLYELMNDMDGWVRTRTSPGC
jgi:hypothetical protein